MENIRVEIVQHHVQIPLQKPPIYPSGNVMSLSRLSVEVRLQINVTMTTCKKVKLSHFIDSVLILC